MSAYILMLNDYCFHQIFKHLSLIDLANVKEAYDSLGVLADMEFSRKTGRSFQLLCNENVDDALTVMKQFGSSVHRLKINYSSVCDASWSEILTVVKEHCNGTLQKLSLVGDGLRLIKKDRILIIADILKNIKRIRLSTSTMVYPLIDALSHCENAEVISVRAIHQIDLPDSIFQNNKNLVELRWKVRPTDENIRIMVDNLLNNQRFERLVLGQGNTFNNISELLRLNRLTSLSLSSFGLPPMQTDSNRGLFLQNFDNSSSLSELNFTRIFLSEAEFVTLSQLNQLKVLGLFWCGLRFESLLILCTNNNFERILVRDGGHVFKMDESKFLELIGERKSSNPKNCLHLRWDEPQHAIPIQCLEANKETIKLIEDPRYSRFRYL